MPVYSLKMHELAAYFQERTDRALCGVDGTVTYQGGKATQLTLWSSGACTAKITRAAGARYVRG